jgi:2-(1,2-epoxy-1,2-dihydrophenyl)acetyl-CoA isomerase
MPDYETILYNRQGRVALVTLNRPEKLNAWNPRMEVEFLDIVDRAARDPEVGVLLITGAGRGFCAGADISGWSEGLAGGDDGRPRSPLLNQEGSPEVPIALRRGKPAIAAINGPAIGIGLTMPLACDIRIASDQARFSVRFVRVGITPECGSSRNLPAIVGMGNALMLALTGRIIDVAEAKERGLVDRVVPHDRLMEEAMSLAQEIAANPSDAVWATKRLLYENGAEQDMRRVVTQEGFAIREMRRLPDHAEAVRAFMEKREPEFNK